MGSYIPFVDDQPFSEKVKSLTDVELLEIWEETQQIESLMQSELHIGISLTPEYEQAIVNELQFRSDRRIKIDL